MKLCHPELDTVFIFDEGMINTLVIENAGFMYRLVYDIVQQINGFGGETVLSQNDKPLQMSHHAEVIDQFIPFEINRKTLLTKITSALQKQAMSPEMYEKTMALLSQTEQYLYDLSFSMPCDLLFPKLSIGSLLKATGPELRDEYQNTTEKIIDYMELVREFDRDKLFIFVNMRSFFSAENMQLFADTALSHGFQVFMIDNKEYPLLSGEQRVLIDDDLCEIS